MSTNSIASHSVVTTVRSQEKADKIKEAYPDLGKDKLDFAIVRDIAKENAFDRAVISDPPLEVVLHTRARFTSEPPIFRKYATFCYAGRLNG